MSKNELCPRCRRHYLDTDYEKRRGYCLMCEHVEASIQEDQRMEEKEHEETCRG